MKKPAASGVRKHKRTHMAVPAFYDDRGEAAGGKEIRLSYGTVRDFSDSGLCLFTHEPLHEGANITVVCKDIWNAAKGGTVLWCNRMDLRLFKVGVGLD